MGTPTASLKPAKLRLEISRGDDLTLTFQLVDSANRPIDISSDDVTFTVRDGFVGDVRIATKTSSAGGHLDGANGLVEFGIAAAETSAAAERVVTEWSYEVRRIVGGPGGSEVVMIQGVFEVNPTVSES